MKTALALFLLLFFPATAGAQGVPMGNLGHPLGTYLTIEGVRVEDGNFLIAPSLLVDTVNGRKLDAPVRIAVEDVSVLPAGERFVLRGYESGKMIGIPPEVVEKEHLLQPQAFWQFYHFFVATSAVAPDSVKYKFIFKEYRDLVGPYAEIKDAAEIEMLSGEFVSRHGDLLISEIYIWHSGLNTENNLLFKKTYLRADTASGPIVYPKINYASPWDINISMLEQEGQRYILMEQQSTVSYRMVILAPD